MKSGAYNIIHVHHENKIKSETSAF